MAVRLRVNGTDHQIDADPADPLLWVLRDDLDLLAAKYGCGVEQCGSCRVLIDGRATASCTLTSGDIEGRDIRTLESLRDDPPVARIIHALTTANAGQCGYCLPGIVVTLAALARPDRELDRATVIDALDAHLCRCGSQPRIIAAALSALGVHGDGGDAGEGSDG